MFLIRFNIDRFIHRQTTTKPRTADLQAIKTRSCRTSNGGRFAVATQHVLPHYIPPFVNGGHRNGNLIILLRHYQLVNDEVI